MKNQAEFPPPARRSRWHTAWQPDDG